MHLARVRILALLAALLPAGWAGAAEPVWRKQDDWALQCDNTRRCSAVAYLAEVRDPQVAKPALAAVRITRRAGASTPVRVDVMAIAQGNEHRWRGPLTLRAGPLQVEAPRGETPRVPAAQALPLVQAMVASGELLLSSGPHRWTFSLEGFREVLSRMDEVQQRQGTVDALMLRGDRSTHAIPGPDSVPVLRARLPVAAVASDARLAVAIFEEIDPSEVDACKPDIESASQLAVRRLTKDTLLVSAACINGVSAGDRHWIANLRPPHEPRLLQDVEGSFDPRRGTVTDGHKLIGFGSCYEERQWQFTAQGFVLAHERSDRMCRGLPDGAWMLPVFVSRVVYPRGTFPDSNRN